MPTIEIAGKQVHVAEDSHSAHVAAKYFIKNPDNAKAVFAEANEAYRNGETGAHYTVPKSHTSEDLGITHHVTMIHHTDGTYTLQKRHGY